MRRERHNGRGAGWRGVGEKWSVMLYRKRPRVDVKIFAEEKMAEAGVGAGAGRVLVRMREGWWRNIERR